MKVLWCRLFGHKWKEWVCTGWRREYNASIIMSGFETKEYGYHAERKHCFRCGEVNPMFGTLEGE
jgi:hypothetical protein